MSEDRLIFVYNADSGLFNTVTDIAHKILSPGTYACNLCALSHGHFSVREHWVKFLETLSVQTDFLHRDEFLSRYGMKDVPLPAIFHEQDGTLTAVINAEAINACKDLDQLTALITDYVNNL
ncbi:MAG: hypothetical protein BMS9Abin26_2084 [Gammaproteobacteria bacterium]|nr:MAG: hypothetical protein BMS9Abin26_2084 [Gammaproteobacteria bacterium]